MTLRAERTLTCGDARFQGVVQASGNRGGAADGLVVPVGDGADFAGGAGDEELVSGAGFGFPDRALLGGDVELLRAIEQEGAGDAGEDFGAYGAGGQRSFDHREEVAGGALGDVAM